MRHSRPQRLLPMTRERRMILIGANLSRTQVKTMVKVNVVRRCQVAEPLSQVAEPLSRRERALGRL